MLLDGALDTSFDVDGKRSIDFNLGGYNIDAAYGAAIQANGKIVVVGRADWPR
jgi:hypothetical protein